MTTAAFSFQMSAFNKLRVAAIVVAMFVPLGAFAQTNPTDATYRFQRQGIFDCNLNGAYAMSVGAMAATGGVYVPVADATVELNTGIIVYKECVLREVVNREREAAMSGFFRKTYVGVQTGRNGKPLYEVNPTRERLTEASDAAAVAVLQGPAFDALDPAMQDQVKRYVLRKYSTDTRRSSELLGCSFEGDLKAFQQSAVPFNFNDFMLGMQPQCDPLFAGQYAEEYMSNRIARAVQLYDNQMLYGRGYYPVMDDASDPLARNILTPAATVQLSFQTALDSPVRQLESANDIGQMIGALYAGLGAQVISDTRGLAGLSQSLGGQPSYLDQMVAESAAGLRNAAANVALNILNAARQVEANYLQAMNGIANTLSQTIVQLRSAENQCWNLVIKNVCSGPVKADGTCDATAGGTLKVATSTMFSQPIIDAQITDLANTTLTNIEKSQKAVTLINNLIAGVTGTTLDAQRLALQQLDALVAQHALHTPQDLSNASQQLTSVQSTMSTLVQDTVKAWADGTPNGQPFSGSNSTGWCNVNLPSVVDYWSTKWKK